MAGATVGVIAEVKRRSPSAGDIHPELDPVSHATGYARGGAVGISVLTDPDHFGGSLEDLERVAAAVTIPVLRKDFIVHEDQLLEARARGGSMVLLIVRALSRSELRAFARAARDLELTTLIEAHTRSEVDEALGAGPAVIGINARDLGNYAIDLAAAARLVREVPPGVPVVAESGIERRADVERAAAAGADFILVGTSVARAPDPEAAVRALTGIRRVERAS
jgi:indole-3-glycerol phosphate synthase